MLPSFVKEGEFRFASVHPEFFSKEAKVKLPKSKIRANDKLSSNVAWTLRFVWQSGPGLTVANTVVTLIQSVLPVLSLYLIKLVVDAVSAGVAAADKTAAFSGITYLI